MCVHGLPAKVRSLKPLLHSSAQLDMLAQGRGVSAGISHGSDQTLQSLLLGADTLQVVSQQPVCTSQVRYNTQKGTCRLLMLVNAWYMHANSKVESGW